MYVCVFFERRRVYEFPSVKLHGVYNFRVMRHSNIHPHLKLIVA